MPNLISSITETQAPSATDVEKDTGQENGDDTSSSTEKGLSPVLTKQEAESRLQQAARILATGAIRAAQKAASEAAANAKKPKPKLKPATPTVSDSLPLTA